MYVEHMMVALRLYACIVGIVSLTPIVPACASLLHVSLLFGHYGLVIVVLDGMLFGDDRGTV